MLLHDRFSLLQLCNAVLHALPVASVGNSHHMVFSLILHVCSLKCVDSQCIAVE